MPDRRMIAVIVACMLGIALFLGVSAANGQPGFPLDDAWIHQTYARNLARSGRFEFVPGVSSAGSTAPLWTLLLVVGYLLRLPYLFWTFLLGGLSLLWLAWAAMQLWRSLWPRQADKDWLAAIITALTWPLLWAAASGMETLLFAALGLQIIALYSKQSPISNLHSLLLPGLLSGLLVLTRPDGVVLLFLLVLGLAVASGSMFDRAKRIAVLAATAVLPLLPYFLFNTWSSGHLWPNTYYAKQTEYAILLARPFIGRLAQLLFFSLGGPESGWQGMSSAHLLLLPGVIVAGWQALRADWTHKRLCHVLPLLWAGGHVFLYAWRLPVMFQHGRYIQPIIPVWVLFGLAGWLMLSFNLSESTRTLWLGRQVTRLTFFVIMGVFWLQGSVAYATDVAIIEGEMVNVAHWLAQNTAEDALIAAHDIGAIGYFAERPLLDLAGLISPEIIPLLSDEAALSQYVLDSQADYLVTAPGWPYTRVANADQSELIYATDFSLTQTHGLNNMAVYQLKLP